MRWDILNHLIKENNYKNYLEIGYYKGWSFHAVKCQWKDAVDPNPSRDPEEVAAEYGQILQATGGIEEYSFIHKMTSDDYFKKLAEREMDPPIMYDIIFIDGLHESQQVDRDIQNALKHLSPGGVIVMHDCNPSSYEMTTTGTASGEWTGDVYKSFCKFRMRYPNIAYVVDTDYGVGIIKDEVNPPPHISPFGVIPDWEMFDKNRGEYLNLISSEEFLKRETNVKIPI